MTRNDSVRELPGLIEKLPQNSILGCVLLLSHSSLF
jgi:hypothetical protein